MAIEKDLDLKNAKEQITIYDYKNTLTYLYKLSFFNNDISKTFVRIPLIPYSLNTTRYLKFIMDNINWNVAVDDMLDIRNICIKSLEDGKYDLIIFKNLDIKGKFEDCSECGKTTFQAFNVNKKSFGKVCLNNDCTRYIYDRYKLVTVIKGVEYLNTR